MTATPTVSESVSTNVAEQASESINPCMDIKRSVVAEIPDYDTPERVKKKPSYLNDYHIMFVYRSHDMNLLGAGGSLPIIFIAFIWCKNVLLFHDDIIKWKHFLCYWF